MTRKQSNRTRKHKDFLNYNIMKRREYRPMFGKLVKELKLHPNNRRTAEGLSKSIGKPVKMIENKLTNHPDTFKKVQGCKGSMWELQS